MKHWKEVAQMAEQRQIAGQVAPEPERPNMPGYGITEEAEGLLRWPEVTEQLEQSRNYWVCTTRPDGRPHAAPVWGVWLDGALLFGTGRNSVKGRNLAHNPAVAVHLESGDDAVMLEGTAELIDDPATLARFDQAYGAKYNYHPIRDASDPNNLDPFYALRPTIAFAWRERDFPQTATRFRFPRRAATTAPTGGPAGSLPGD
jgi:PPOX class probable F420-dependent enzyme